MLFHSIQFEIVRGLNWIYLPVGIQLRCILAIGGADAIGVLIASWLTCVFYVPPTHLLRSCAGGIASAAAGMLFMNSRSTSMTSSPR